MRVPETPMQRLSFVSSGTCDQSQDSRHFNRGCRCLFLSCSKASKSFRLLSSQSKTHNNNINTKNTKKILMIVIQISPCMRCLANLLASSEDSAALLHQCAFVFGFERWPPVPGIPESIAIPVVLIPKPAPPSNTSCSSVLFAARESGLARSHGGIAAVHLVQLMPASSANSKLMIRCSFRFFACKHRLRAAVHLRHSTLNTGRALERQTRFPALDPPRSPLRVSELLCGWCRCPPERW